MFVLKNKLNHKDRKQFYVTTELMYLLVVWNMYYTLMLLSWKNLNIPVYHYGPD